MDLVANFDKEYDELLAQEDTMSPEEYNQAWKEFLNRQNQIDIDLIDDCEEVINNKFHDQPELKEKSKIINEKFRDITQTFKEYLDSGDNDKIWADLLEKHNQINIQLNSFQ